ncbi:MAG: hypothetical protein ACFE9Z_10960 [Promethearchaeota archaeon]
MSEDLKKNLLICVLIIFIILSISTSSLSTNFSISEEKEEDYLHSDNDLTDFYVLYSMDYDSHSNPKENLQLSGMNTFFEWLQNKNEEIVCIFSINCIISILFLLLIKNESKSDIDTKIVQQGLIDDELSKRETIVYDLIQEYLCKNRVFDKNHVISFIKSRSNMNGDLNKNGISIIIDNLLKKNIILEGSKLTRKTVLLNSNRTKIFNLIKQNPGIYKYKIAKALNLCLYVVNWHLSKLLAFNLIREHKNNNQICYFNSLHNEENDQLFQTINKVKCRKIIDFLFENEDSYTKNQISNHLNMHFNTLTKYINKMDKYNLLIREEKNQREYISLNKPKLSELLDD